MVHCTPWHKIARTPKLIRAKTKPKMLFMLPKGKQKTKNSAISVFSDPSSCFQNYKPTTPTIDAAHTLTTVQATLNKLVFETPRPTLTALGALTFLPRS